MGRRPAPAAATALAARTRALAIAAALVVAPSLAAACGLEDPTSITFLRGSLQLAYPEALHVGTAVWQAQLAGTLPRDAFAQQADLSPEARAKMRLFLANAMLGRLSARLSAESSGPHPGIAIVLIGPVLWARLDAGEGPVKIQVHVPGPERDDVVIVTDIPVIEAIAKGDVRIAEALEQRVMRLYGPPDQVAEARRWLVALR